VAGDGDSQIDEAVKAELLLAEARWRRGDQRLGTLFALNFAVLAILGASIRFGVEALPGYLEFFGYTTLFMLTVNVLLLIWAYRLGFSSRRPDLEHLEPLSSNVDATILRLWVAREIRLALEVNENRLQNKATWITRAMISSLFTVIMVAAMTALFLRFSV